MNDIHTINDFMNAVAEAISDHDADTIERLGYVVEQWLQTDDERSAQNALLNAASEVIEELFQAEVYAVEKSKQTAHANIDAAPIRVLPEMVACDCGHECGAAMVMSASLGTSCPDCYDTLSD